MEYTAEKNLWWKKMKIPHVNLTGKTRVAFLQFFASHIPVTVLVDAQAVLPAFLMVLKKMRHSMIKRKM